MVNSVVFQNLAKDLFGRLGIDFEERKEVYTDTCPDVTKILDVSINDLSSLNEKINKFSTEDLIALSKPQEFDQEITKLAAMDNQNPTDPSVYDPNSPIKADVAVLEQIFAFTATMHEKLEKLQELLPDADYPKKNLYLAPFKDQLTVAVNNLKNYILKPIIQSLDNLFDTGYRGELKSVINNILANMTVSFNEFLGTEDRKTIS